MSEERDWAWQRADQIVKGLATPGMLQDPREPIADALRAERTQAAKIAWKTQNGTGENAMTPAQRIAEVKAKLGEAPLSKWDALLIEAVCEAEKEGAEKERKRFSLLADHLDERARLSKEEAERISKTVHTEVAAVDRCYVRAHVWEEVAHEIRNLILAGRPPAPTEPQGPFTGVGPCGRPRCPKCGNSFQNGVPADAPNKLRCATCKTVWEPPVPTEPQDRDAREEKLKECNRNESYEDYRGEENKALYRSEAVPTQSPGLSDREEAERIAMGIHTSPIYRSEAIADADLRVEAAVCEAQWKIMDHFRCTNRPHITGEIRNLILAGAPSVAIDAVEGK